MVDILFTAKGAEASAVVSGKLTSGMVGVPVQFYLDNAWSELNVIAVFDGGGHTISVPLLGKTETIVPWEVIAKANTRLRIGAEGRKSDGSIVIPTVWANVGYIAEGVKATDEEANPPTPGIYDQMMAAIWAGLMDGEESADFPGCLYRRAGSEIEWLNPPMVPGVEYRTTERHNGLPVYTMLVDCGSVYNSSGASEIFRFGIPVSMEPDLWAFEVIEMAGVYAGYDDGTKYCYYDMRNCEYLKQVSIAYNYDQADILVETNGNSGFGDERLKVTLKYVKKYF